MRELSLLQTCQNAPLKLCGDPDYAYNNNTEFENLGLPRKYNMQFDFSNVPLTLKQGRDRQKWYKQVDLSVGYYHEYIQTHRRKYVWEKSKANITFLAETEHSLVISLEHSQSQ